MKRTLRRHYETPQTRCTIPTRSPPNKLSKSAAQSFSDLLETNELTELNEELGNTSILRLHTPSRVPQTGNKGKVLEMECKRLRDLLTNPRVVAKQHTEMYKAMYKKLKTEFQKEYEMKIGTLYPDQIGYRDKYVKLKKEFEMLKRHSEVIIQELKEEVKIKEEIIDKLEKEKEELLKVKQERDSLLQEITVHICPKIRKLYATPRPVSDLLQSFWSFILKDDSINTEKFYKKEIASAIAEKNNPETCTHSSLFLSMQNIGFYISHAEAVSLISQVADRSSDNEKTTVSVESLISLMGRFQPYPLWEDVHLLLLGSKVRLCRRSITRCELRDKLFRHSRILSKETIVKKCSGKIFNLIPSDVNLFADFLLRGEESAHSIVICTRVIDVLGELPDLKIVEDRYRTDVKTTLAKNAPLRQALQEAMETEDKVSIEFFTELWRKHERPISEGMLFYILCVSCQRLPALHISLPLVLKISKIECAPSDAFKSWDGAVSASGTPPTTD